MTLVKWLPRPMLVVKASERI